MIGWADLLSQWPEVPLSYNVAPSAQIAAFSTAAGQAMRWGLVPFWANEFNSKYATFNARVETVADKPTYRNAWRRQQRCLIPMRGYYEWQAAQAGKQPFFITDRNVGGLVAAGLFEPWGKDQFSCTMITRPADAGLDRIHGRMPVLLTPETAVDWLQSDGDESFLMDVATPDVVYWPVSKAVGNVRNNDENLSKPIDQPDIAMSNATDE